MDKKQMDITEFKANNKSAFIMLLLPFTLATASIFLSLSENNYMYWSGQILLSFFFLQTFILLHECAHLNFFKTRNLNVAFGHVFGLLSMIPFYSWQQMHQLHHKWTGWRDKDPTTESTVNPPKSKVVRWVVNMAWLLFIPIFYIAYKVSNYWNVLKMERYLNDVKFKKAKDQVVQYVAGYVILFTLFGDEILYYLMPGFVISLIWKELVILTQHTHVEIPVSYGKDVKPIAYIEQVPYTRSFYVNGWFAKYFLLNFNLHEAHHAYPGIPAYQLDAVELDMPKTPTYGKWFSTAKGMWGSTFIFKTSKDTGAIF